MARYSKILRKPERLLGLRRKQRQKEGVYRTTYLASVNGTVIASAGYFWVHDALSQDTNGYTTYSAPYRMRIRPGASVSLRPDIEVNVRTINGLDYVDGLSFDEYTRIGIDQHQTNSLDRRHLYNLIEQLSNLQSFPDNGTATVRVMPSIYRKSDGNYAVFTGESGIDIITGYTPSTDNQKVICLWLDETTNTVTITASSEVDRDTNLKLLPSTAMTYINECAASAPYGAIGITSYIIYDDTTTISSTNKFHDLRGIIGSSNGGSGGGSLGYPDPVTSNLVIADGKTLLVDSGWVISTGGGVSLGAGSAVKQIIRRRIDSVISVSANYSMTRNDDRLLVDASGGAVTITLPDATRMYQGHIHSIKATDVSGGTITLDPFGSQTIDGASSKSIAFANTAIQFYSDGSNVYIT